MPHPMSPSKRKGDSLDCYDIKASMAGEHAAELACWACAWHLCCMAFERGGTLLPALVCLSHLMLH